ncbi:ABC transporter permease [Chloroflexota bacterium]
MRDKPLGAVGGIIFMMMIILAILAPLISPYDPITTNVANRLMSPSMTNLMGTDHLGRDLLSRVIFGAQISVLVGVAASVIGTLTGGILGLISGYVGGRFDMIIQRFLDILLAFPALILALAIMAVMGTTVINVIIAISIPFIPRANRVVRSVALSVKEFQFVEAATAVGAKPIRIIFVHILPNTLASYLIIASSLLGSAILIEASLSFLGLGIPPPYASWGRSLSEAMTYYIKAPWLAIFPGVAISLAVFGINLFGDALRDVWDPKLKRI